MHGKCARSFTSRYPWLEHVQVSEESVRTSITQTILCWCEIRKLINVSTKYLWNVIRVLIFTAFFRKILLNLTTLISRVTFCFHKHVLSRSKDVLLLGHPSHLPKHLFQSPAIALNLFMEQKIVQQGERETEEACDLLHIICMENLIICGPNMATID